MQRGAADDELRVRVSQCEIPGKVSYNVLIGPTLRPAFMVWPQTHTYTIACV